MMTVRSVPQADVFVNTMAIRHRLKRQLIETTMIQGPSTALRVIREQSGYGFVDPSD